MTGFGDTSFENDQCAISVKIKSLNSKYLDANVLLPKKFFDKEMILRKIISQLLERGKVWVSVDYHIKDTSKISPEINEDFFLKYYSQLKRLANQVDASQDDLFKLALQSSVIKFSVENEENKEKEWKLIEQVAQESLEKCKQFRAQEGGVLKVSILEYVDNIWESLVKVEELENERVETVKARLKQNMKEMVSKSGYNPDRFEQEIIYYLEKLDITEEKTRLKNHLNYFKEVSNTHSSGRKLGFISQEIGREINTIGSKANHAGMQKLVVGMKDNLEKIKEQSLNIL